MAKTFLKRVLGSRLFIRWLDFPAELSGHRDFLLESLPKNSVCAEIGVHKGDFSSQILKSVSPFKLHLIDPWKYEGDPLYSQAWYGGKAEGGQVEMDERYRAVCQRFSSDIQGGRVEIHRGISGNVLEKFPDEYFDWIYIDGNHLEEFVRNDLEISFRKTKPSGYITGDDYHDGGWWQGGVKKAVDAFIQKHPVALVMIRNRQFILRK